MDFKDDAGIDPGSIGSPGGGGGGGRVAIGGGAGVVVLLIAVLLGVNPGDLLGQNDQSQTTPANSTTAVSRCRTGADVKRDPNCRWAAYATSINQYWETQIEGYTKAKTTPFSRSARTGCGHADAQTGPFYCPPDKMVYLDTNFLGTLLQQLGTQSSTAAEAYIMAHEYGHHAQDLLGTLSEAHASGNQT
ncbi:MAG: neutral zinc metallopeptidase, partial [Propionibacterium sp.]|nr:neutral zinc metallopeptidase [Propionibacterium sp.]